MSTPLQPEFFLLLGIDLFQLISLLSCLLDKHFPWQLPYLYQTASLAGFGQLIVSKEFMATFDSYMRFWFSFLYLAVALANIVAINVYLGIKRLLNHSKVFMLTVSFPSVAVAVFFLASYSSAASHTMIVFPPVSSEIAFSGVVAFDALVIGFGTYKLFKPKWWRIALAVTLVAVCTFSALFLGPTTFVFLAIALAAACTMVLAVSLRNLVRIAKGSLENKSPRR
jgi:hypothetical protein